MTILVIFGLMLVGFTVYAFVKKQRVKGVRIAGYQYAINWIDLSSRNAS